MDLYGFISIYIRFICVLYAFYIDLYGFTLPFIRCVVSPAGATHFQISDFFRALFYEYYICGMLAAHPRIL